MSVYVFVGPTLSRREARHHLDAVYLPPVSQGDVARLLDRQPTAIGIIDGYFELVPSVWHKEILLALEAGVHVFGAASMGALRAAELDVFGMQGIGEIYRWYASRTLEDDDEVALVHGPAEDGYRALSEAMVNVRDRCATAARRGIVSKRAARQFVDSAKALFYPERHWPRIFAEARRAGLPAREMRAMAAYLETVDTPSLKARDAVTLLRRLARFTKHPPRPFRARVRTERTKYIGRLLAEVALPAERPADRMAGEDAAWEPALLRVLLAREALHAGHQVTVEDVHAVEDALRRELGLLSADDTANWLRRAGFSPEDFDAWMRDEALAAALQVRFANAITRQARIERRRLHARALAQSPNAE